MTLHITAPQYALRWTILKMTHRYKKQLTAAYQAKSPRRIYVAKRGLIHYLHDLIDSPELGPAPPFKWPTTLQAIIEYGGDPTLPPTLTALQSWAEIAAILESSLKCPELSKELTA